MLHWKTTQNKHTPPTLENSLLAKNTKQKSFGDFWGSVLLNKRIFSLKKNICSLLLFSSFLKYVGNIYILLLLLYLYYKEQNIIFWRFSVFCEESILNRLLQYFVNKNSMFKGRVEKGRNERYKHDLKNGIVITTPF